VWPEASAVIFGSSTAGIPLLEASPCGVLRHSEAIRLLAEPRPPARPGAILRRVTLLAAHLKSYERRNMLLAAPLNAGFRRLE
jgi:hypothetical protein